MKMKMKSIASHHCEQLFLVTAVGQMALGPASCLTKMHCTDVLALQNDKFSRLGVTHPIPPKVSSLAF